MSPNFDEIDLNRIYNALNYYCLEVGDNGPGGERELQATKELRDYIGKMLDDEPEEPQVNFYSHRHGDW